MVGCSLGVQDHQRSSADVCWILRFHSRMLDVVGTCLCVRRSCMEIRTCEMLFGRVLLLIPSDSRPGGLVLVSDVCVSKIVILV